MKFRTHYNERDIPRNPLNYEENTMPGKTIPDDSLSLREILTRYAKGAPLSVHEYNPIYHGEDVFLPDFSKMDLSEIQSFKSEIEDNLKDTKQKFTKEQREREQKRIEAAAAKLLEQKSQENVKNDKENSNEK